MIFFNLIIKRKVVAMTQLEKALELLVGNYFAELFTWIEDKANIEMTQDKFELNLLKNTYIRGKADVNFSDRLETFVRKVFNKNRPATHQRFITQVLPTTQFIGRQSEIENLHQRLQAKKPTVLVNGIGGVGKTALAKKYVEEYQEEYNHIVWLDQQNSLLNAFITNKDLTENMGFTDEPEIERFERILNELQSKKGRNLLIVDNYQKNDFDKEFKIIQYFYDLRFQEWSILFTSRQTITHFDSFTLGMLPEEEAIELFLLHCPNKKVDEEQLKELFKLIDYHTLTIELLAKNYSNSWDLENIQQVIELVEKKNLNGEQLQSLIEIGLDEQEIKMYNHLVNIFNIKPLSEEAKYLFKQFAVLPHQAINGKQFLEWLNDPKRTYKPVLEELAQKGWLSNPDKLHFEMHRLVAMLMLQELNPSFDENEVIFDSILDELKQDKIEANPLASQYLTNYGNAFLDNINFQDREINKAKMQHNLGVLHLYLGFYTYANDLLNQSLNTNKELLGENHENYITSLNDLSTLYHLQGEYDKAEHSYLKTLIITERVLGKQHRFYANTLSNLGLLYESQGKYLEAEPIYREVLNIDEKINSKRSLKYSITLNHLGSIYYKLGKYDKAENFYKKALKVCELIEKTQHPYYATYLNNIALLYNDIQQYQKTMPLYQEALKIRRETLHESHPDIAQSLSNLGLLYYNEQQYEKAEPLYIEALEIREKSLKGNHPDIAQSLNNLALLYHKQKQYEKAKPLYEEALEIYEKSLERTHPKYSKTLSNLGLLYYNKKDYQKAKKLLQEALKSYTKVLGEEHSDTKNAKKWLELVKEEDSLSTT